MATGIELIVAAAMCVACPALNESLPANLIQLSDDGSRSLSTEMPIDVEATDAGLDSDTPVETLETIINKKLKLREMRDWIKGKHLRIATLEDYPLSYTEVLDNGTRIGHGVSFQIIDFLKKKFNFTYEVFVPQDNIIGSPTDFDRSLIEMVNSSLVDLAAAFIPSLSDQRTFVYYSTTTLDEGEWIMVMQRPRESASGSGLLAPFEFWVWILILVSLLAVGPIIYALIILRNRLTGDAAQHPYSLGHCAWFVYGALMKQGSTLSPIADSTRLLFATWWIFITILTSFYTANLTAFLTLSKFTLPYNTVNDILVKNKHFVSMRGGGVEYAIRTTNESLSMLNRMIQNNYAVFSEETNDTYNLQNYVERNGYVFVRDRPAINIMLYQDYLYRKTISYSDEKIHCPFAMAREPFLKKKRTFAYPIGSNLSQLFDPELLNLVESGIVKHLSAKDLPSAEICPQDLGGTERQLRNGDLMMTYYIMLAGFATSLAVFSTELIFRYVNSRHEANKWARHGIGRTPNGQSIKPSRWLRGWQRLDSGKKQLLGTSTQGQNVTPPPPYQSIFNGGHAAVAADPRHRWKRAVGQSNGVLLGNDALTDGGVRRLINGRDYLVFRNPDGQSQLVPVRSPSAALFQYTYTE
ncbi:glutamate receptor ionotropic, delta-1 [Drosophila guanche]|uniref:Blast:Glutamate receptor ionotropic, delta-1 n=1 Tax=Drosophila guanche TaxID=7266 RepID=A0A3B0JL64_DROGU|nr:glutamate receptor ionotropic, delta-1 [Drosophila guanche]SPP76120.1 blast:Glutamate receptor ionotropic%2C delta-1 [Drosophila guanche]